MRVHTHNVPFIANSALGPYLRVKLSSGKLIVAAQLDVELGTLEERVLAADDAASVIPENAEGAVKMIASKAIAQYAAVYGADGGKVTDASNANYKGVALTSASGDGSEIVVMRKSAA